MRRCSPQSARWRANIRGTGIARFGSFSSAKATCSAPIGCIGDRKSTRLNSSHLVISYAVFCLKKKKKTLGGSFIGDRILCHVLLPTLPPLLYTIQLNTLPSTPFANMLARYTLDTLQLTDVDLAL